jgi:hypothetical protein
MGGCTTVERLHGGVLPSRVLTDRGLVVVRSTASSRCGDHSGLEYTGDDALLHIFYPHKAVVATLGPSAWMAAQHLLASRHRSTTVSPLS